jgi:hypothetical protein
MWIPLVWALVGAVLLAWVCLVLAELRRHATGTVRAPHNPAPWMGEVTRLLHPGRARRAYIGRHRART